MASQAVGIRDASIAGRIRATGKDVLDLLHRLSTNTILSLAPGQGAATVLTTPKGRIIDILTVLPFQEETLIITSPGQQGRVLEWIDRYTFAEDVSFANITGETAMATALGPRAPELASALGWTEATSAKAGAFTELAVAGVQTRLFKEWGPLLAFSFVVPSASAPQVRERLLALALEMEGSAMSDEAFERLRIKAGLPVHGKELGEAFNPLEAGLQGLISFTKGCYIGQEVVLRLTTYKKVQKHLVRLKIPGSDLPGDNALSLTDGRQVGFVTSSALLHDDSGAVALAYVKSEWATQGTKLLLSTAKGRVETLVLGTTQVS